jgi:fructokinase
VTAATGGVVALVGEALVDFVQPGPEPLFEAFVGGSPANVAVGLARLGAPARLPVRIGADPLGRRIRRHLDLNGVDLSYAVAAREHSSLAIVAIGEDGAADYDFPVEGTADWQWRDGELSKGLDPSVVAVHSGSLALTRHRVRKSCSPLSGRRVRTRRSRTTRTAGRS